MKYPPCRSLSSYYRFRKEHRFVRQRITIAVRLALIFKWSSLYNIWFTVTLTAMHFQWTKSGNNRQISIYAICIELLRLNICHFTFTNTKGGRPADFPTSHKTAVRYKPIWIQSITMSYASLSWSRCSYLYLGTTPCKLIHRS